MNMNANTASTSGEGDNVNVNVNGKADGDSQKQKQNDNESKITNTTKMKSIVESLGNAGTAVSFVPLTLKKRRKGQQPSFNTHVAATNMNTSTSTGAKKRNQKVIDIGIPIDVRDAFISPSLIILELPITIITLNFQLLSLIIVP
jgi:hypothetical protein